MLRETILHKFLGVPHRLHIGIDRPAANSSAPVIVFIHGLGRTHRVWNYAVAHLPKAGRVISVDLLGFGASPKPDWHSYNATGQAQSLHMTLRLQGIRGNVIIVGHSLGALVAIEYARLYPKDIRQLVLCSAPIYLSEPKRLFRKFDMPREETMHLSALKTLRERTELMQKFNLYARKAKLVDDDFIVDERNIRGVVRSIEMAIENQSAYDWLMKTAVPAVLIYGAFDPYVIKRHYRDIEKSNRYCDARMVLAGHEVSRNKAFAQAVSDAIRTEPIKK